MRRRRRRKRRREREGKKKEDGNYIHPLKMTAPRREKVMRVKIM